MTCILHWFAWKKDCCCGMAKVISLANMDPTCLLSMIFVVAPWIECNLGYTLRVVWYNWLQNYLPNANPMEGIWISITFNCVFRTPTLHRVESKMFSCYLYSSSVVSAKLIAARSRGHQHHTGRLSFDKRFLLQDNLRFFSSIFMEGVTPFF